MSKLLEKLDSIARSIPPGSIALTSGNCRVSYDELSAEVTRRARWLRAADSKVVALHSGNTVEWVLIDLACQALKLVLVPLPAFFSASQIQDCLRRSGVDTLLSDSPEVPGVTENGFISTAYHDDPATPNKIYAWRRIVHRHIGLPEETGKITFTSGSTGNPKGVCLSTEHQWQVAQSLADVIDIDHPRHLCLLPLSTLLENVAGIYAPVLRAGEVIIPPDEERGILGSSGIDAKALLDCISNTQPDSLILVPQLLTFLVQACLKGWAPPKTFRFIAVGGGKVSPQLIQQARQFGLPVYQGYGLSECGSVVALNTQADECIDSVGRILPHCRVVIENDEVVVTKPIHLGYMEDQSTWYPKKIRTGDVGRLEENFLVIEGRKKNVLITSFGRNISPEWVESVMMSDPLLNQCVVLGDAKPYLVSLVCAPESIGSNDISEWIESCNQSLPDYAKIGGWTRVADEEIEPFITSNGRPQRERIKAHFSNLINELYQNER